MKKKTCIFPRRTAFLTRPLIRSVSEVIVLSLIEKSHDKYFQVTLRNNNGPFENVSARKEIIIHIRFNDSETFFHVILFILTCKVYYFCLKWINENVDFCHIQLSMRQDA